MGCVHAGHNDKGKAGSETRVELLAVEFAEKERVLGELMRQKRRSEGCSVQEKAR